MGRKQCDLQFTLEVFGSMCRCGRVGAAVRSLGQLVYDDFLYAPLRIRRALKIAPAFAFVTYSCLSRVKTLWTFSTQVTFPELASMGPPRFRLPRNNARREASDVGVPFVIPVHKQNYHQDLAEWQSHAPNIPMI